MDKILSYLPEKVHVGFGWKGEPHYYGDIPKTSYSTICIPKEWIKHNKRSSWNEWEIKKSYHKKLANEFGEKFLHSTEPILVKEWNQLENIVIMYKNALDYVEPENNDKIIKPIVKTSNIIDEDDYSEDYLPCTLAEEIAVTEYVDNGGTFDKKTTTSSIADMLGKDNPLLKLKFN